MTVSHASGRTGVANARPARKARLLTLLILGATVLTGVGVAAPSAASGCLHGGWAAPTTASPDLQWHWGYFAAGKGIDGLHPSPFGLYLSWDTCGGGNARFLDHDTLTKLDCTNGSASGVWMQIPIQSGSCSVSASYGYQYCHVYGTFEVNFAEGDPVIRDLLDSLPKPVVLPLEDPNPQRQSVTAAGRNGVAFPSYECWVD